VEPGQALYERGEVLPVEGLRKGEEGKKEEGLTPLRVTI